MILQVHFENILLTMRISITNKDIYYEFKPLSIKCINVNKFHLEYSHLFPDNFEHEYKEKLIKRYLFCR